MKLIKLIKNKKPVITIGTIIILLIYGSGYSAYSAAGSIADGMDAMWSKISPDVGNSTNSNYGVSLGGVSLRSLIRGFSILSYDPPRFSAGCGGIDAYFGSFSMISEKNIKNLTRAIMSNAAGYAIKIALDNLCPPCQNIMSGLQDQIMKLNSHAKNTCQLGMDAVDIILSKANPHVSPNPKAQAEAIDAAATGAVKDMADANDNATANGATANRAENSTNKSTEYGNNLLNTLISAGVFEQRAIDTSAYGGDKAFVEMAMNLYGTQIILTGANTQSNASGKHVKGSTQKVDKVFNHLWSFEDVIEGAKPDNSAFITYKCNDFNINKADSCQSVITDNSTYPGTARYIMNMLIKSKPKAFNDNNNQSTDLNTIEDGSIMYHVKHPEYKLSPDQQKFFDMLPPITKQILNYSMESMSEANALKVINHVAYLLGKQMAAQLTHSMNQMISLSFGANINKNGKQIVPLSKQQDKQLKTLQQKVSTALDRNNIAIEQQNLLKVVKEVALFSGKSHIIKDKKYE